MPAKRLMPIHIHQRLEALGRLASVETGLNKEHLQWLQAIADRAACGLIAVEGSSLFSEENAAAVKKSFPDVIAGLARAQEEDDAQPLEPESPNE
eukprot:s2692_g4.t1